MNVKDYLIHQINETILNVAVNCNCSDKSTFIKMRQCFGQEFSVHILVLLYLSVNFYADWPAIIKLLSRFGCDATFSQQTFLFRNEDLRQDNGSGVDNNMLHLIDNDTLSNFFESLGGTSIISKQRRDHGSLDSS